MHTKPDLTKRYMPTDFSPYVKTYSDWDARTLQPLPNAQTLTKAEFINSICSHRWPILVGHILDPRINSSNWGTVYLGTLQNGNFDGTGYVAISDYSPNTNPYVASFALCKHTNLYLPSANPSRGLHDQFCTSCGLDTSVDSSD